MMQLYYTPNSNPRLAVAVARHLDSPVEFVRAQPRHPAHQEAFRPLNPNTLAPVLKWDTGTLWEADAIACHLSMLAGSDFWRTNAEMPEMIRWISWTAYHFAPAASPAYFELVVLPTFSKAEPNQEKIDRSIAEFSQFAAILDDVLATREWLVGDHVSYADFRVASQLPYAEKARLPLGNFPHVKRWHDQLLAIKAWRDPFEGLNI